MTGYSGTPLAKKLGFKPNFVIKLVNEPEDYWNLFEQVPDQLMLADDTSRDIDLIHLFTYEVSDFKERLPKLKNLIHQNGSIWVSWPKKASGISTDMTGDVIRRYARDLGLIDSKVCAVDEKWSGLKLIIPVKDRKK